jgi:sec-independent protein translocase protein TatA
MRRVEDETMGDLLQPTHLLIIAVVLLVLFGAKRLPELGKGLGEGLKGFKEGLKGVAEPNAPAPSAQQQSPPPAPSAQQQNAAPAPPASAPIEPK